MTSKRTQFCTARQRHEEYLVQLIRSQIAFGLTYLEEARAAYGDSRHEFADTSREIAVNSYRSAVSFATRLARGADSTVREQLDHFRDEMLAAWPDLIPSSREIA